MKRLYLYIILLLALGHFLWEAFFENKHSPKIEIQRFPAVVESKTTYVETPQKSLRRPQSIQSQLENLSKKYLDGFPYEFRKRLSLKASTETVDLQKFSFAVDGIDIVPFEILIPKDGSQIPANSTLPPQTPAPDAFPKKSQFALISAVSKTLNKQQSEFKMSQARPLWIWNSRGFLEAKYEVRIDYTSSENLKVSETWFIDAKNPLLSEKFDRIRH